MALPHGDLICFRSDVHEMGLCSGGGQLFHTPHFGHVVRLASLAGWFQDAYGRAVRRRLKSTTATAMV